MHAVAKPTVLIRRPSISLPRSTSTWCRSTAAARHRRTPRRVPRWIVCGDIGVVLWLVRSQHRPLTPYKGVRVMQRTDEDLLAEVRSGHQGEAFAEFYRRHERPVLAYFVRRVRGADVAAELMSETFAEALASRSSFQPYGENAAARWLFGIARYTLTGSVRRGEIESRARRRLQIERPILEDERLAAIDELAGNEALLVALEELPEEQREAIRSYVLEEDDYASVAARLQCTETVARKRVSRGLARIRRSMENA